MANHDKFFLKEVKLDKNKLGNKLLCPECEVKFYDLGKPEIVCPSCGFNISDIMRKEAEESEKIREKNSVKGFWPTVTTARLLPPDSTSSHTTGCKRMRRGRCWGTIFQSRVFIRAAGRTRFKTCRMGSVWRYFTDATTNVLPVTDAFVAQQVS